MLASRVGGFRPRREGLRNTDAEVASAAATVAFALIANHHDLGPDIRAALGAFRRAFPDWGVFSDIGLELLAGEEGSERQAC